MDAVTDRNRLARRRCTIRLSAETDTLPGSFISSVVLLPPLFFACKLYCFTVKRARSIRVHW